ncbi:sphingosine kinase 2-like [Stegodyphus dumicola]|uniref:sphingosine kinase 2-like n=1 Tax=Stegodyphus dumicola TaxID=202533 RepID=UPI0015AABDEB|nr:sphingosine kinase 2-like [Stegodyphus dumicola]
MALKCSAEKVILEDLFYSYPAISFPCELSLTEKILTIHFTLKGKTDVEMIDLSDIVGCHVFRGKSKLKNESEDSSAYICIYSYPLKTSAGILSKQLRRERRVLTFQMRKFETQNENLKVVNKWRRAILCLIRGISCIKEDEIYIPDVCPHARKFLILVNPRSGPGKACQIFKERVVPLLTESDISYELLVTGKKNTFLMY